MKYSVVKTGEPVEFGDVIEKVTTRKVGEKGSFKMVEQITVCEETIHYLIESGIIKTINEKSNKLNIIVQLKRLAAYLHGK